MPNRVLFLNLSDMDSEVAERPELFERYVGGVGVAAKLLQENCPEGVEAFSPEAPMVFAIGPLTLVFPCCTKVVSLFKSPLTGNLGESCAGGRLGLAMRLADYDAIVIKGRADSPTYVAIHDDEVSFKDASALWGASVYSTGRVLREIEPGAGRRSIIRIGVAGEQKVRFANVNVDTYRHFGRMGLGAVFGSKNLKAIVISGSKSLPIEQPVKYREVYSKIYKDITEADWMKKYHDLGTSENVVPLNLLKGLPTRNLMLAEFERAHRISGERFAEEYLTRKIACPGCPVGCIHIASLRLQFAEGYEYGSLSIPYDYEPIYALGSMLGIDSPDAILKLIEKVDRYGLDAMSTGVVLAWATEAQKLGVISEKETLGVRLSWGDPNGYSKAIDLLVDMPNKFYRLLARGVEAVSSVYGGQDFALALGRNEIAGYHCGPATILGQLVGCRHSHLDNAGYALDQKGPMKPERIVEALMKEEQWRCVVTSLVICLFARKVYAEEVVREALSCMGVEKSIEELWDLGREIYKMKYSFKLQEKFSFQKLRIPKRFFEVPSTRGKVEEQELRHMLKLYEDALSNLLRSA
jgi:aldehyde:ferredoxin oxidoreductase